MTSLARFPPPATRPPLLRLLPPLEDPPPAQSPLPLEEVEPLPGAGPEVDPEAARVAASVTRALVEVLTGLRPVAQLRPVLVPRVAHLLDHLVRARCATGLRLAGLRLQSPRPGVVEVSARLSSPARTAALAVRLERRPLRWALVTLEAGLAADARLPARS